MAEAIQYTVESILYMAESILYTSHDLEGVDVEDDHVDGPASRRGDRGHDPRQRPRRRDLFRFQIGLVTTHHTNSVLLLLLPLLLVIVHLCSNLCGNLVIIYIYIYR